jgi:hypothetical protein
MTTQPTLAPVAVQQPIGAHRDTGSSPTDIPALNSLALRSLASLFNEEEQLFFERITLTKEGLKREGTSRKHTIIALLGLQRLADSGATLPFDIAAARDRILGDTGWVGSAGDLGLLTWFTARCAPEQLGTLLHDFDFENALDNYPDGRHADTRGIAWFLTGIAHAREMCPGALPDLTDVAAEAYRLLRGNQRENGIFGRTGTPRSIREFLANRFGTFADQIHALYALTRFSQAFEIEEPLEPALNCANSLCALQGELGQWWFLYDKRRGSVANRYPVCSAHQDGTAPAALLALEEATGQKFHAPIQKGLAWITGANELGDDLRSLDRALIWDSIGPRRRIARYWGAGLRLMRVPHEPPVTSLGIRYEARPDHFGWLLYAFGRFGLSNTAIATEAISEHSQAAGCNQGKPSAPRRYRLRPLSVFHIDEPR